ncbi:MAG TPA: DUF2490 domain-containing protein [Hymenobacter sp.]|jgi:hypothetical protein|uniref:DUF2490 domain-containing protein n=1 Tax=Hymenobacter sp. TaxID=1898978 RepID=UPI002EDA1211
MRYFSVLACGGLLCLLPRLSSAQPTRVSDYNTLGWFQYNGDHQLAANWTLHTEYQARGVRLGRSWQQRLARLGLAYQVLPRVQVAAGYTSFITHPFGRYPTASTGVPFPERRFYQDVQVSDTAGRVVLSHRLRLEQRWIGQLADNGRRAVQAWQYQNRIRYQLAATVPLQGRTLDDHEWYFNAFDELFLGFGRNVNLNVFNQNRLSGGLGYQLHEGFQLELNYLNQISQHGDPDPATNLPVVEFNHGVILGLNYSFSLVK